MTGDCGHAPLHEPRASPGPARLPGPPHRHLFARRDPLRVLDPASRRSTVRTGRRSSGRSRRRSRRLLRKVNVAIPRDWRRSCSRPWTRSPRARFATARELADDLRRFLRDEPILARRSTPLQRARRWAWRHRPVMVSAAVTLLTALTVLAGSVGWIMRDRAARQARRTADLQAALKEGQRFQEEGLWPRAQAAARRRGPASGRHGRPRPGRAREELATKPGRAGGRRPVGRPPRGNPPSPGGREGRRVCPWLGRASNISKPSERTACEWM